MPRGIDLYYPFPRRISPDLARARTVHLQWPCGFGLLDTQQKIDRHVRGDYPGLAARFYPTAAGTELDLGVDLMSWFFLFDDLFDGPHGEDPPRAEQLIDTMVHALEYRPREPAAPIVKALADLWQRSCVGMSGSWRIRAARHWRAYLVGHVAETRNRHDRVRLTVEEYLRLRRDTIGVQVTVDLAESIGHYEIPDQVFFSWPIADMRTIAADVDTLHNDIVSVEKEQAAGDIHNILLILEREKHRDRSAIVDLVSVMLRKRVDRFIALESRITALCANSHLSPRQSEALNRYVTDALRPVMRGAFDWAEGTGRYAVPTAPKLSHAIGGKTNDYDRSNSTTRTSGRR